LLSITQKIFYPNVTVLATKTLGQTYEKLRIRSDLGTSEENLTLNLRKNFDQCSIRSFGSAVWIRKLPVTPADFPRNFAPQITGYNIRTSADLHIRILPPAAKKPVGTSRVSKDPIVVLCKMLLTSILKI